MTGGTVAQDHYDALVVGSGHAGVQVAMSLRQGGFEGSVAIVSADSAAPYDRPSLSKDYLMGAKSPEQILLTPATFWAAKQVELLLGRRVTAIDPKAQQIETASGDRIGYSQLVWAAGGSARRLRVPGSDLEGVHYLRSLEDADRLRTAAEAAENIAIVGAGYIGLEAAAALSSAGKRVTVIEAAPRVLSRVAGPELSDFYYAEHVARGVDIRLDTAVERIEGTDGQVTGVRAGGAVIPCDILIAGIGLEPEAAALRDAGAKGRNGVDVDDHCRTSLPGVFAIGDCAAQVSSFAGADPIRLESVQNAADQAKTVAKTILGKPEPHGATPWFWSTQYDLRLQTVGLSTGHDQTVLRGDTAAKTFSVIYLKQGRVTALDCVNATRDYVQGRKLVEAGACLPPDRLADAAVPLKSLLAEL